MVTTTATAKGITKQPIGLGLLATEVHKMNGAIPGSNSRGGKRFLGQKRNEIEQLDTMKSKYKTAMVVTSL